MIFAGAASLRTTPSVGSALSSIGALIVPVPITIVDVLVSVRRSEVLVEVEMTEVPSTLSKLSDQQTRLGAEAAYKISVVISVIEMLLISGTTAMVVSVRVIVDAGSCYVSVPPPNMA